MRYMIISDIHANKEALEVLLDSVFPDSRCDTLVCLGDLVGYGPDPEYCITRMSASGAKMIRGNHDRSAAFDDNVGFSEAATLTDRWAARVISTKSMRFLANLPQGPAAVDGKFVVCHGSPLHEDVYVDTEAEAFDAFKWIVNSHMGLLFCGHTHIPQAFVFDAKNVKVDEIKAGKITLEKDHAFIVNPGSIGQSRDGNPKAAYAIYDEEKKTVEVLRFAYPASETIKKTLERNLACDEMLAAFLRKGK